MPHHQKHQADPFISSVSTDDLGASTSRHCAMTGCARNGLCLLRLWRQRVRDRRELFELTDMQLHDFGVTRCEAMGEYEKPFWRA